MFSVPPSCVPSRRTKTGKNGSFQLPGALAGRRSGQARRPRRGITRRGTAPATLPSSPRLGSSPSPRQNAPLERSREGRHRYSR
eukprot:1794616-Pyramimonas_sp.AAC.1